MPRSGQTTVMLQLLAHYYHCPALYYPQPDTDFTEPLAHNHCLINNNPIPSIKSKIFTLFWVQMVQ